MASKKNKKSFILRHKKTLSISGMIIAFMTALIFISYTFIFIPVQNPNYGVTFTKQRAEEFNLDWKETYLALLDDMGLRHFRLTSYWSDHEIERGQFDFTNLDWLMDEAHKRGATVSLATGLRQPRWPECHQPAWSLDLKGHEYKQALYAYIEQVTNRYKTHPALESWQLENEGVNDWFGLCEAPDRDRIHEEFNLIKQWDPNHPIKMSLSDQHGIPATTPVPDAYGYSVYRIVYNTFGPQEFYVTYPTPLWYHHIRTAIIRLIYNKPFFIHELQMEPWGPRDTSKLSIEEQDKSMSVEQIPKSFMFARRIGFKDIDLWGGEWWYWRKTHHNDSSIWDTVKEQISSTK